MSNSKLAKEFIPAKYYSKGRDGRKISMITLHHMAGVMTAKQCGKVFQTRKASSQYGIGYKGEIAQYVDEKNTSWANGNWDANCKAVTIETSNNKTGGKWTVSDKSLKSLIKLVADIAYRNKLGKLVKGKNLTWHRMYMATTCPGDYLLSKIDYIVKEANKINEKKDKTNKKEETKSKYVLGLYKVNTKAGLNVRKSPKIGKILKVYSNGTKFDTYEIKDNWAKTPSGWVCLDYCKLVKKY